MADTPTSVSALQTLLADNTTGAISPQDLRNFLVSALGVYGQISVDGGTTQQNDVSTTGSLLTCFTQNDLSNGTTPDHTNDRITVSVAGVYEVHFSVCFTGSNGAPIEYYIRKNGTSTGFGTTRAAGTTSGSASVVAQVSCAANDIITIYVNSDTATDDITVQKAQLTVKMIG